MEKDNESGDIWWVALKSKTHMEEDIPKELVVDKPEEIDIACGHVARNFWNYLVREATIRLEDNVGSNLDKSEKGTTIAVLNYGSL